MRSIRLVAGSSSPVLRVGYETKMNVEKHECSLLKVVSDVGSTPTASTILIFVSQIPARTASAAFKQGMLISAPFEKQSLLWSKRNPR